MVHRLPQLALTLNCHSQAELKSGESYRGELFEAEDNWNVQLKDVTATAKVSAPSSCNSARATAPAA